MSLGIVLTGRPSSALLLAAAMLATAPAVFGLTTTRSPARGRRPGRGGELRWTALRRLLPLYAVATFTGIATGVTTVAIPAAAGPVFAAAALGEVIGAMIFGSRAWPLAAHQQLRAALLAASGMGVVMVRRALVPAR